jgi:hypothetical protein
MKQLLMVLLLAASPLVGPASAAALGGQSAPVLVAQAVPAAASKFVTVNADGSPVACEDALKAVRDAAAATAPPDKAKFDELQGKGIERCNADDDKRADEFFAAALALVGQ